MTGIDQGRIAAGADAPLEAGRLLSTRDVRRAWLRYYTLAETGISYDRLQALGLTHALLPALKKLYPNESDLSDALTRHLTFFNTQAVWGGGPITGVVLSMEERRARGERVPDSAINGIKSGLMGPLAGLGDSIDWVTVKPLIFALAAGIGATGNIVAPFILLLLPLLQIVAGLRLSTLGYEQGRASVQGLLGSGRIKEFITAASTLGLFMMGALSAAYVQLSTPVEFDAGGGAGPLAVQDILDGILPGLLPLAVVFALYFWLSRKKQNLALIALAIVAFALLGAFIGIV